MNLLSQVLRQTNVRRAGARPIAPVLSVVSFADLTLDGAFALPREDDNVYGNGLAYVNRPTDTTNPHHVIILGPSRYPLEYRIPTTLGFGTGYDPSTYPLATLVKDYGASYAGVYGTPNKLLHQDNAGVEYDFYNTTDGRMGLIYDADEDWLYVVYGDTYSTAGHTWMMVRLKLNYAANTATCEGPWKFKDGTGGQGHKSTISGGSMVPAGFANAYLGGKRLMVGWGGYGSLVEQGGDIAYGPSGTAFDRLGASPTEKVKLASTPMFGKWPATDGRYELRAESLYANYNPPFHTDKWCWLDLCTAGTFVYSDTGSKWGIVVSGKSVRGSVGYAFGGIPGTQGAHWACIVDPMDTAPVAGGNYYDVTPAEQIVNPWNGVADYDSEFYADPGFTSGWTIAATVGQPHLNPQGASITKTAHGLVNGNQFEIRGATETEFNGFWGVPLMRNVFGSATTAGAGATTLTATGVGFAATDVGLYAWVTAGTNFVPGYYLVTGFTDTDNIVLASSPTPSGAGSAGWLTVGGVKNANEFFFYDTHEQGNWANATATGSVTVAKSNFNPELIMGMDCDRTNKKLYVAVSKQWGANNLSGLVLIERRSFP